MKIVDELIKLINSYKILLLIEDENFKEAFILINSVEYSTDIVILPVVHYVCLQVETPFYSGEVSEGSCSPQNEMQIFSEFDS